MMELAEIVLRLAAGFAAFLASAVTLLLTVYKPLKGKLEGEDSKSTGPAVHLVDMSRKVDREFGPASASSPAHRMFRGAGVSLRLLAVCLISLAVLYYSTPYIESSAVSYYAGYIAVGVSLVAGTYAFLAALLWHLFWSLLFILAGLSSRFRNVQHNVPQARREFVVAGEDVSHLLERSATVLAGMRAKIVVFSLEHKFVRANKGATFPSCDYSGLVHEITVTAKAAGDNTVVEVSSVGVRPGLEGNELKHRSNVDRFVDLYLGL